MLQASKRKQDWGRALVASLGIAVLGSGCAVFLVPEPAVVPATVSVAMEGSPPGRRASLGLVSEGLEADAAGQPARAMASYERALQVDPSNPYAYLAIARQLTEGSDPQRALNFLDQADALFEAQGDAGPEVEVLVVGLRGEALQASGQRTRAFPLRERARELGPSIWYDDHLSAEELL